MPNNEIPQPDQLPDHTETLNEIIESEAGKWTDQDILALIAGFREQRVRWNTEQSAGSRTRVPAKKITVSKKKINLALEGLKL